MLGIGNKTGAQTSWKMDLDYTYYRILDSGKNIVGYFDPYYGEDITEEQVEIMLKRKDPILGGDLMVPMLKFGLFDRDLDINIDEMENRIKWVNQALVRWSGYMQSKNYQYHSIRISHSDQDMLTMTIPIQFHKPVRLDKEDIAIEISHTMEALQRQGLLELCPSAYDC